MNLQLFLRHPQSSARLLHQAVHQRQEAGKLVQVHRRRAAGPESGQLVGNQQAERDGQPEQQVAHQPGSPRQIPVGGGRWTKQRGAEAGRPGGQDQQGQQRAEQGGQGGQRHAAQRRRRGQIV